MRRGTRRRHAPTASRRRPRGRRATSRITRRHPARARAVPLSRRPAHGPGGGRRPAPRPTARGHEVRAHRLRRLGVRADVAHAGAAPAQHLQLDRDGHAEGLAQRRAQRRRRVQAQDLGVAAGRGGVEVGDAPHAAVDVVALADAHGGEDPRDRARRRHRLGDGGARRAGRPEHDAPPRAPVDAAHAQAPVEARAGALELVVQPRRACARCRARATAGPSARSAPPGAETRGGHRRQRRGGGPAPARGVAQQAAALAVGLGHQRRRGGPRRAAQRRAGRQARGHDRAGGGAHEGLDRAQVGAGLVLDAGQHAGHPGLADDAAAGEDEDVGCDQNGHPPQPTGAGDAARPRVTVCDSIRLYRGCRRGDPHPHRPAGAGAARGDGPLAARPRRALGRQRPDAQPGRARRDEPDAADRQPHRRRGWSCASASSCASTRRAR